MFNQLMENARNTENQMITLKLPKQNTYKQNS